jgi:hypothetical protein
MRTLPPYRGVFMRGGGEACFALALLAAACGGNPNETSSNQEARQLTLRVTTSGSGVVRGGGADCRSSCSGQYVAGSQVHLVAVPDPGSVFTGWAGACGGSGGCDLSMEADRDVTAAFSGAVPPGSHRLTVIAQGKGRITSSPSGIDCDSATCSADFPGGTSVTLTAAPDAGFQFDSWGGACTGAAGCAVSLANDAAVFANFIAQAPPPPSQVHLVATVTGPGTVGGAGLNCGEATSTCDVTVAGGTAVTLTATAAGATRFFGWGGACAGNSTTCQLTLNADTKVTAEFQSEVLVLAANDGTNLTAVALNSTRVFWPRWTSGGSAIWSVAKNGGEPVRVAGGTASAMVADDSYLYWTDQYNLYSAPVGGGQVAQLASGFPIGKLVLDEVGALYWTAGVASNSNGSVHRMQDRGDTVLAADQHPTGALAVDSTWLYFADYDGMGSVRRVPRKGGTLETLVACDQNCSPSAIRVDVNNVYFRDQNGNVFARGKADGILRTISTGNGSGYTYSPELDVNASLVYWNWTGGNAPYGIFRANPDGTGFRAVDTSNDSAWSALRVDDNAIYYFHGGALIRRLK